MADGTFDEVLSAMKTELIPQERIERAILAEVQDRHMTKQRERAEGSRTTCMV